MILGEPCSVNTVSEFWESLVIRVRLREAMEEHRRRSGERMTYELLAARTGLARTTIESIAARETYNTRLSTIAKLCTALGCAPADLLELSDSDADGSNAD